MSFISFKYITETLKSLSFILPISLGVVLINVASVSRLHAEVDIEDAKAKRLRMLEKGGEGGSAAQQDKSQLKAQVEKSNDRNRARYFISPSNLSLKNGESYFSQGIMSTYGRGLSDDLSLHLRFTSLVFMFYPISVASLQYNFDYATHWRGGVGIAMMPWDGLITYFYKSITYGDEDAHITLSLGQPINAEDGTVQLTRFLVSSLSGNVKVSKSIHLIAETWMFYMLNSHDPLSELNYILGFRFQGEQFALDLGNLASKDSDSFLGIPWLELTWNFD